jgi:hypothetical protein
MEDVIKYIQEPNSDPVYVTIAVRSVFFKLANQSEHRSQSMAQNRKHWRWYLLSSFLSSLRKHHTCLHILQATHVHQMERLPVARDPHLPHARNSCGNLSYFMDVATA